MRGDRIGPPTFIAATLVNEEGIPKYHLLPSRLVMVGIISMGLLLLIAVILGFLVLKNRADIDDLRYKIRVEEGNIHER